MLTGCSLRVGGSPDAKAVSGAKLAHAEGFGRVPSVYPFAMAAAERTTFQATLRSFKAGDPYDFVVKKLGEPYYVRRLKGKRSRDPVRGILVTYYLRKLSADVSNERLDEYVILSFNNDDRLVEVSTNIPGGETGKAISPTLRGAF